MLTTSENIDRFVVRTYGFSELAQCYLPSITKAAATNRFRSWLNASATLLQKLSEADYKSGNRLLTPKQVSIIITHLGEP